jgi:hypothetical protein
MIDSLDRRADNDFAARSAIVTGSWFCRRLVVDVERAARKCEAIAPLPRGRESEIEKLCAEDGVTAASVPGASGRYDARPSDEYLPALYAAARTSARSLSADRTLFHAWSVAARPRCRRRSALRPHAAPRAGLRARESHEAPGFGIRRGDPQRKLAPRRDVMFDELRFINPARCNAFARLAGMCDEHVDEHSHRPHSRRTARVERSNEALDGRVEHPAREIAPVDELHRSARRSEHDGVPPTVASRRA